MREILWSNKCNNKIEKYKRMLKRMTTHKNSNKMNTNYQEIDFLFYKTAIKVNQPTI